MTTLNSSANIELTLDQNSPAGVEGFWSRVLEQLGVWFGKTWGYLNEDMGPVDPEDNNHFTGGCCC